MFSIFHYFILFVLITGWLSALYMVFVVCRPKQVTGPLWNKAMEVDKELFERRRSYVIESWIIFVGLALYSLIYWKLL